MLLAYNLWSNPLGLFQLDDNRQVLHEEISKLDEATKQSRHLTQQVQAIQNDEQAIEEQARSTRGLVGPDEVFFNIPTPPGTSGINEGDAQAPNSESPEQP